MSQPVTAREIQRHIMRQRFQKSFILHNFTPSQWFECDIFEVTGNGYFIEYEIKGDYPLTASSRVLLGFRHKNNSHKRLK